MKTEALLENFIVEGQQKTILNNTEEVIVNSSKEEKNYLKNNSSVKKIGGFSSYSVSPKALT